MRKIYYTSFPTAIGRIYLAATEKGICRVAWEYKSEKGFIKTLLPPYPPLSPLEGERIKPALECISQESQYPLSALWILKEQIFKKGSGRCYQISLMAIF